MTYIKQKRQSEILLLSLAALLIIFISGCYGASGVALDYYEFSEAIMSYNGTSEISSEATAGGASTTSNETESAYSWQEIYTAKLRYYAQLPAGEPGDVAEWRFILHDINQNGIPELFLIVYYDGLVNIHSVYSIAYGNAVRLKTNMTNGFAAGIVLPPNDAPGIISVSSAGIVDIYDKFTLNGTVLSHTGSGDIVAVADSFRINARSVTEEEFEYTFGRLDEKLWLNLHEITDANMYDIIFGQYTIVE